MKYSLRYARFSGLVLAVAVIVIDQWSKQFFLNAAQTNVFPLAILPVFNIVIVQNRGISFGMFAGGAPWLPHLITLATSLIVLLLALWLLRTRERRAIIALGIIIGGALGNIIDRISRGFVVDFLDFHLGGHHWPAFNIADSAVFIGVVILVLMGIVRPNTDL